MATPEQVEDNNVAIMTLRENHRDKEWNMEPPVCLEVRNLWIRRLVDGHIHSGRLSGRTCRGCRNRYDIGARCSTGVESRGATAPRARRPAAAANQTAKRNHCRKRREKSKLATPAHRHAEEKAEREYCSANSSHQVAVKVKRSCGRGSRIDGENRR